MQAPSSASNRPVFNQTPVRRAAASSLLAKFSPGSSIQHKMDVQNQKSPGGDLPHRSKSAVTYAESESSSSSSQSEGSPNLNNYGAEPDDEIIEYAATPRRRALRERRPNMSLKAQENSEVPKRSRGRVYKESDLEEDELHTTPVFSGRTAIRQEITNKTAALRNRFLVENKDFLLPLLPPNNHIRKMVEKHEKLSPEELAELPTVTPYEEIGTQPRGVTATMKPYQLSGLSFMVYLHRNGLSGILGDEMGLGKTLQTLSLVQYLKENHPKTGTGKLQRPFLVVCPLSVLSSWMGEAKKWTPGLKVVRFHGPIKERVKLKKIVMGEIDMYGNLTHQARSKFKSRRNASRKHTISLDTDSDNEEDVGVDLVVTTYESFKSEQAWFKKAFIWRYVVLDEGHTVKNHESLVSRSLQGMNAEYRLILTGTPLQNNLSELWSLLHWLYPEVFADNTNELFDKSFNLSKGQYSKDVLDNSRRLLELIMLRRMKGSPGVDLNLPPKTEVLLFVPLSPMQRFWYERMITRADQGLLDELFKGLKDKEADTLKSMKEGEQREAQIAIMEQKALEMLNNGTVGADDAWKETKAILQETVQREQAMDGDERKKSAWQKLMNLLMQLRKVCNHPYQISHAEPNPYHVGDHVIHASGKFIILEKLLNELVIKQKKKILIFSGFTKMLDLVEELLLLRGGDGSSYRTVRIDGATARARRNLSIRMFNDMSSDYRVMLISTRAGGLGINLASASDVVLLDQDWNPQITLQAEARAHRIGQKNPVTIYKLVAQGTVEEQMMGRIQKKLYLSAKVTEAMEDIHTKFGSNKKGKKGSSSEADDNMPQLSTSQLMTLVRRGASAISRPEIDVNEMLAWDWDTTVMKCKDQPTDINVKKDAIPDAKVDQEAEQKWLTELERVESSVYAGKKLGRSKHITHKELAEEFDRAERRKGKNTTVVVDGFAISKESMNCAQWEAVPTMAGKNAAYAEPKRSKREAFESQSHCQICIDGGEMFLCQRCPRSYHLKCLDQRFQATAKSWQFNCPQHECYDCLQKTTDAGGMLYRCQFCERAFCEDCLNFEKSVLIGDTLPELELLNYPEAVQAFYVRCHICVDNFELVPRNKKLCEAMAESSRIEHRQVFGELRESSTRPASLTDATTVETTSVNTPVEIDDDEPVFDTNKNKRKLDVQNVENPFKRARLGV